DLHESGDIDFRFISGCAAQYARHASPEPRYAHGWQMAVADGAAARVWLVNVGVSHVSRGQPRPSGSSPQSKPRPSANRWPRFGTGGSHAGEPSHSQIWRVVLVTGHTSALLQMGTVRLNSSLSGRRTSNIPSV